MLLHKQSKNSVRRIIAISTALVSAILSIISTSRCTFVLSGETGNPDATIYAWGLFTTPVYDMDRNIEGCIPYPSSVELGRPIKTAQAFAVLLNIETMLILLGLLLVQLFLERGVKNIYHSIGILLPCAFLCQLLTFTSFASSFCSELVDEADEFKGTVPVTCVPGGAGTVAIFNLVAMIILMTIMSMLEPPEYPVFQLYGTGNSVVRTRSRSRRHSSTQCFTSKQPTSSISSITSKKKRLKQHEQCVIAEPKRPGKQEVIKTTIVNGPDGRQTIKEITRADGSKTITTTFEEIRSFEGPDHGSADDREDDTSLSDGSTILEVL